MAPWRCGFGHWGITESIFPREPRAMLMPWLLRCPIREEYAKCLVHRSCDGELERDECSLTTCQVMIIVCFRTAPCAPHIAIIACRLPSVIGVVSGSPRVVSKYLIRRASKWRASKLINPACPRDPNSSANVALGFFSLAADIFSAFSASPQLPHQ
jgi:hypothetical protein